MRPTSIALILFCLCVTAAAEKSPAGTRIFDAKIVTADVEKIVATASFDLAASPGKKFELVLRVRARKGEIMKIDGDREFTLSWGPVTMPEGKDIATWKDCPITLDPKALLRSTNLRNMGLPLRLSLEFSLRGLPEGKPLATASPVSTPLELHTSPDGEVLMVEHMGTWLAGLKDPEDDVVYEAAQALLFTYGESITEETRGQALAALVSLFGNDDLNGRVSELLLILKEAAAKPLIKGLASSDPMVRAWCGTCLLQIGTYGRGATLALFDGMRHAIRNEEVYALRTLAQALEQINPRAIGAAEVLSVAIEDPTLRLGGEGAEPDTVAVCAAIAALAKLGTAARPAIPILQRALTDPDEQVREAAKRALNKIPR